MEIAMESAPNLFHQRVQQNKARLAKLEQKAQQLGVQLRKRS